MSTYYEQTQWSGGSQAGWEHQTPPPARSGASSAIPREEPAAFLHQFEEVDRAVDNLLKSGKMYTGMPGGRRELLPYPGPTRMHPPAFDGRAGPGPRPHSIADYGDSRGPPSNLQNFYANQRHQPSRGSNEAEQMIQAKRRMAAQRERELRNYHQEQQYNRTVLSGVAYGDKPDRALSPGNLSEEERRKLIAQQRNALYGEGPLSAGPGEAGNFPVDLENAASRAGISGHSHSPLAYEYGRPAPPNVHPDSTEGGPHGSQTAGPNERSRANSNSSPQSNAPAGAVSRTSASSPGGSPPRGGQNPPGTKPGVAPIGTRPSVASVAPSNPALSKRATTPLPSPLSQGYTAAGNDDGANNNNAGGSGSNPSSAAPIEGGSAGGIGGWPPRAGNGWGNKTGLNAASVWG